MNKYPNLLKIPSSGTWQLSNEEWELDYPNIGKAKDKQSALKVLDLIEDISQAAYYAAWLDGIEYDVWHIVNDTVLPYRIKRLGKRISRIFLLCFVCLRS